VFPAPVRRPRRAGQAGGVCVPGRRSPWAAGARPEQVRGRGRVPASGVGTGAGMAAWLRGLGRVAGPGMVPYVRAWRPRV
jgi:hypothetical protein